MIEDIQKWLEGRPLMYVNAASNHVRIEDLIFDCIKDLGLYESKPKPKSLKEYDRIFILAGNYQEYDVFIRSNSLQRLQQAIYLRSPIQLKGVRENYFVKYGSYWTHKNYEELEMALASSEMVELTLPSIEEK